MKSIFSLFLAIIFYSCGSVQYFIVRHAEKETPAPGSTMTTTGDPSLSPAGKVRAIELREELKDDDIRFIFSTNTIRTISTAQPLNNLRGGTHIELYNSSKDSLEFFIQKLKTIRKGNSLIVGHSNTVDDIVNKLCGSVQVPSDLKDSEYDNLFIVTRKGKNYVFSKKTYGTPTE
jgi:phosphohistidine phosphatase SixA